MHFKPLEVAVFPVEVVTSSLKLALLEVEPDTGVDKWITNTSVNNYFMLLFLFIYAYISYVETAC